MQNKETICKKCKWYEIFNGICCNGDCKYCADTPPFLEECEYFKENEGE